MKTNIEKAVGIIAALSLLLGLSIGRIHQQHREINQLKTQGFSTSFEFPTIIIDESRWARKMERKALKEVHIQLRETEKNLRHFQCRMHNGPNH